MRSRTSFFNRTVFLHDLKRWWPLTAGYTLLWLLILPLSRLTELSRAHGLVFGYADVGAENFSALNIAAYGGWISALLTSILFAVAAFSYLTNARATNGLHALPVRRETLYVTHYLAGLCSQIVPQMFVVLLTAAVFGMSRILDVRVMWLALLALVLPTLFFYSFAVFCVMFTGQLHAAPVFYGVLNVLVVGVETMIYTFAGNFLYGWVGNGDPMLMAFSPAVKMMDAVRAYEHELEDGWTVTGLRGLNWLLLYAAVGLAFAALGLLVYRKRHSEATGMTVAIGWARPIFKYGVAFCAALALGQLLYNLYFNSRSLPGALLCMAAAGLIGYFIAEMLLKKSFRVLKSGWRGAVTFTAVLAALGCALSFDLTGYEGYVPDVGQIESANVHLYVHQDGVECNLRGVDNAETLRCLVDAHRAVVSDEYRHGRVDNPWDVLAVFGGESVCDFDVTYTLQNGRTVERAYVLMVNVDEQEDAASPTATLTALCNTEDAAYARVLRAGAYAYGGSVRELPGLRFTGGDLYYLPGDDERDRELTAHEAELIYAAVLRDVAAGHVSISLLENEPVMNADLMLYATYNLPNRLVGHGDPATYFFETPPERDMTTFDLEVTARMTETVATLRAMGCEVSFRQESEG